jgi:hypothetical protein
MQMNERQMKRLAYQLLGNSQEILRFRSERVGSANDLLQRVFSEFPLHCYVFFL